MKHASSRGWRSGGALAALALTVAAAPATGQDKPETYNATASLKTAAGATMTAPVVITIDRWTNDADREKAVAALKAGGTTGLQKQLAGTPAVGTLQVGEVKAPLHFARSLPVGGGKVVTVVTSKRSSTWAPAPRTPRPRPGTTSRWCCSRSMPPARVTSATSRPPPR